MKSLLKKLGPVTAVIGAQWGDEGKGKITDILAEHFDVIARGCGGANAGHTVVVKGKKHVFHLLPAGSLHAKKPVILGSGMVIHLPTLLEEIETLEKAGISILKRLFISEGAHVVFEYHKEIDGVLEMRRGGQGIGTTRRGIGPAYAEKAARTGIRIERLREESDSELRRDLEKLSVDIQTMFGVSVDIEKEMKAIREAKKLLSSRIFPIWVTHEFLEKKKTMLIEGAQATLLDIDHGTYPFVTSSSTTAAGALQGLALPPKVLASCIGVAKAYCTRVGSGDFPAEADEKTAERLRKRGGEYGATTGRPRRCGWLSIPDLEYAARINGFSCWNITKLDVLDEEETIPVFMGEKGWKKLPGWQKPTSGVTDFKKLPKQAQAFIKFIEQQTKIPVSFIGTGQERKEMIVKGA